MRLQTVLWMSLSLALTGCAAGLPPCNRGDVQQAYDGHGVLRTDAVTVTQACMNRIIGDLNACYREAQ